MPIRTPAAPAESLESLRAGLELVLDAPVEDVVLRMAAAPHDKAPGLQHAVYSVGLDDLASGDGLSRAKLVAWRYLLGEGDNITQAAEVFYDEKNETHEFLALNEGPFVQPTATALQAAEQAERVQRGSYELRVLRIPALYVVALWLKDDSGEDDLFVPMEPTHHALVPGQTYSREELDAILSVAAKERLGFDDSPESLTRA